VGAAKDLLDAAGPVRRLTADKGYHADALRQRLREVGGRPVIPGRSNRKTPVVYNKRRYRERWRIEAAFCRLKDFRRVATRYDKLAANFLSAVALAAIAAFWSDRVSTLMTDRRLTRTVAFTRTT
jgi:transposase